VCGDNITTGLEECDDGNLTPGDGCSEFCTMECGTDCFGPDGCLTPGGKCVRFTCRSGDAGPNFCTNCMGWADITYDQWMNGGYCSDLIATYRAHYGTATRCGGAASCCSGAGCVGGDNAWHFHDGVNNRGAGPCLGCSGDVNCSYWNFIYNDTYTRITACERLY
ncbi:DUF4215 domain-containing protein, partial [Myxococcota bacterium]|nr:DUF4215 domain-containing protein [Myxococcota bacterium]MBU1512326.1 DUF4215 domain-containing protein [Myxococcota bacterium]